MKPEAPRNWRTAQTRRWVVITVISTLICAVLGMLITARMQKIYRARASLFVQSSTPGFNIPSGLLSALPMSKSADPTSYAVAIMQSDSFARQQVRELRLLSNRDFNPGGGLPPRKAPEKLKRAVTVRDDKHGLIEVTVDAPGAQLAADIANAYITRFQSRVETTNKRKRIYTEGKIQSLKADLLSLQRRMKEMGVRTGVVDLPEQTKAAISKLGLLQNNKQALAIQLQGVESDLETAGSLAFLAQLKARREALLRQQEELDRAVAEVQGQIDTIPEAGLELARLQQEISLKSKLFQAVAEQHQLAQIAEQADMGVYQTVDRAEAPPQHIRPRRIVNLVLSIMVGIIIGAAISLLTSLPRSGSREELS